MATEGDHIRLANRNHELLLKLLADGGFPDWAVTVAFYKAVHVVEAAFASLKVHSASHTAREEMLKRPRFKGLWKDYSHLLTASRIARYLSSSGAGEFHSFSDYLDLEGVKKLVRKRLYGVEQGTLAFLTTGGKGGLEEDRPCGGLAVCLPAQLRKCQTGSRECR
jgi:hypothetical protein